MRLKLLLCYPMILIWIQVVYSQGNSPDNLKRYEIKVPANAPDWIFSGVNVKKGDFVLFQAFGRVDLGSVTKDVSALGSSNPFLIGFNRYVDFLHGNLLCKNEEEILPSVGGALLDYYINDSKYGIPLSISKSLDKENFIGNYFISTLSQELKFVINDKEIGDNHGFFIVDIAILSLSSVPDLTGNFDFAKYVDSYKGVLPFCFEEDCMPKYNTYKNNNGGLWFEGSNDEGHYYLTINPLGSFDKDISEAMELVKKKIYYIFPGRAVDQVSKANPQQSTIQLNHYYDLLYKFLNTNYINEEYLNTYLDIDMTPEVKAVEVSNFHFTFEAQGGKHTLKGTAIHGLFKDKCNNLYMFQQGRGVPDEFWIQGQINLPIAFYMWEQMAENMKTLLH